MIPDLCYSEHSSVCEFLGHNSYLVTFTEDNPDFVSQEFQRNLATRNEGEIDPYLESLKWRESNSLQKMNFNRYQGDGITIYK